MLDADDPLDWANSFGITHPVVRDPGYGYYGGFIDGSSFSLPSMTIVAAGGEIVERNTYVFETDIVNHLP